MTKREYLHMIFEDLKCGLRMCEIIPTKNLSGEVVGYHQGLSFSCDWNGHWSNSYLYFRGAGSWAKKATLQNLAYELEDCELDNIVTESEFEKKSGKNFFGWRI